jgi:hypothetical protein
VRRIIKLLLCIVTAVFFAIAARHRLHQPGNGDLFAIDAVIALAAAAFVCGDISRRVSRWRYYRDRRFVEGRARVDR